MRYMSYGLLTVCVLAALSFGGNAVGLFNLQFWGTKYQDARTDIFEETKAYKHGTIRDIENLCLEVEKVESESHKQALRSTIRHRLAAFDYNDLPRHVQDCVRN